MNDVVLQIRDLVVTARAGMLVRAVNLTIRQGEVLALVGESGSGKSLTCLAVGGLLAPSLEMAGSIDVAGQPLSDLSPAAQTEWIADQVGFVFQNSLDSFNPLRTIGATLVEAIMRTGASRTQAHSRALAAMHAVGIADAAAKLDRYPHQLSGGQRQRVMIALATCRDPKLLIADEPTTALDTTTQQQILLLLRQSLGQAGALFVTHDLGTAAQFADRIAVMYHGRIVETGSIKAVLAAPAHPYTAALLAALPRLTGPRAAPRPLPGMPLSAGTELPGCAFAPRCEYRSAACEAKPPFHGDEHSGHACWNPLTKGAHA